METAEDGLLVPARDQFMFRSAVSELRGDDDTAQGFNFS